MLVLETGGDLIWESCSEIRVALKAEAFSGKKEKSEHIVQHIHRKVDCIFSEKPRTLTFFEA